MNIPVIPLHRLKFVGNAIIDFLISYEIYKTADSRRISPGYLTEVRSSLISRAVLGKLAIEIKLDKHIYDSLLKDVTVTKLVKAFRHKYAKPVDSFDNPTNTFLWKEFPPSSMPKQLPSIFESLIGAMYLDNIQSTKCSLKTLKTVWSILKPFFKDRLKMFTKIPPTNPINEHENVDFGIDLTGDEGVSTIVIKKVDCGGDLDVRGNGSENKWSNIGQRTRNHGSSSGYSSHMRSGTSSIACQHEAVLTYTYKNLKSGQRQKIEFKSRELRQVSAKEGCYIKFYKFIFMKDVLFVLDNEYYLDHLSKDIIDNFRVDLEEAVYIPLGESWSCYAKRKFVNLIVECELKQTKKELSGRHSLRSSAALSVVTNQSILSDIKINRHKKIPYLQALFEKKYAIPQDYIQYWRFVKLDCDDCDSKSESSRSNTDSNSSNGGRSTGNNTTKKNTNNAGNLDSHKTNYSGDSGHNGTTSGSTADSIQTTKNLKSPFISKTGLLGGKKINKIKSEKKEQIVRPISRLPVHSDALGRKSRI